MAQDPTEREKTLHDVAIEHLGAEWWTPRGKTLQAAAAMDRVRIAVVGQFNAGKSTLINALVGTDLLPIGALPTSTAIAEVTAGPEQYVRVAADGLSEKELPITRDEFARLAVTEGSPPALVRAWLPSIDLPAGVTVADTPGINSLTEQHAAVTYGYLPTCDAVLLVADGSRGLVEGDLTFLHDHVLVQTRERLIVVLSRMDARPPSDRAQVIEGANDALKRVGVDDVPVLASFGGLTQHSEESKGKIWASVQQRILAHRGAMGSVRRDRALARIGAEAIAALRAQEGRLTFDAAELEAQIAQFSKERADVRERQERINQELREGRDHLAAELRQTVHAAVARIARRAPEFLSALENEKGDGSKASNMIRGELAREIESLAGTWLKPRLEAMVSKWSADIGRLYSDVPALTVADPKMPGGQLLDTAVEVGLVLLLNIVLPGEWIVALLARLLGGDDLGGPIKAAVRGVAERLFRAVVRGQLESQLEASILGLEPGLAGSLLDQVDRVVDGAISAANTQLDQRADEATRGADAARKARREGTAAVDAARAKLRDGSDRLLRAGFAEAGP